MIPLRDANPSRSFPLVNVLLIAANCLVFIYEISLPQARLDQLVFSAGMVPARVAALPTHTGVSVGAALLPLFTSMFLHGGWLHLIGNMWFLWIFGDNIEDRLGHLRYLLFYFVCGLGAGVAHIIFNLSSSVPSIGASGAIAGVLGAYLILFPAARVLTLVPFFFLILMELPAYLILLYWIVLQLFSGVASLGAATAQTGGVAWWAHIGGFGLGMVLIRVFGGGHRRRYSAAGYQ